jgi:hypothetical protein
MKHKDRLASATGRLKQAVDEAVREIQQSHPNATREGIIEHLAAAGFDENDWYPPHLRGVTWDKQLTDRGDMAQTQRKIHPALLQAAKTDPILSYMIKHGLPLNRKTWIGGKLRRGQRDPQAVDGRGRSGSARAVPATALR